MTECPKSESGEGLCASKNFLLCVKLLCPRGGGAFL
jgi:hypothetical protein